MFQIPPLTSDILVVNFDSPSSPSISINLATRYSGSHTHGWGLGWYPGNQLSAMVIKDPVARGTQVFTDSITDWSNFRSNIFFCKVRGADSGYSQAETQPFARSFAGRDWLFLHNGDLDKSALIAAHGQPSRLLEPLGGTDSEFAFCVLLSHIEASGARQLSDVKPDTILGWFQDFDRFGSADMYLTDGQTVCCFQGSMSPKQLYYSRLQPPENLDVLNSSAVDVILDDPRDAFRTAFVVSSSLFSTGNWTPLQHGQLVIANHGVIVWDSAVDLGRSMQHSLPPLVAQETGLLLYPTQVEQSLMQTPAETAAPPHVFVTSPRTITQAPDGKSLSFRVFDVTHTTHYDYTQPVEHSTHLFRLLPTDDPIQQVLNSRLVVSSPAEEIQFEDVFGNQSVHCNISEPYSSLTVTASSRVKIFQSPPDDHGLTQRQTSIPMIWMPWQRQMMQSYLLPPELPESQLRELTNYAMSFVERNSFHLIRTLSDINLSIYRDYKYVPGSTLIDTTPFEVYTNRQGVCQDFANLFICLTRLLSIPARYRMGYIYTGANHENKIQSDASHAWAEVYLPYVGWRGFDPTNGCQVAQDHVRVACGRNYIDATPTSGTIYRGGGTETLRVEVNMIEVALP